MILVTGANGFVGSAVAARLACEFPANVRASVRQAVPQPLAGVEYALTAGLSADTDWSAVLRGVHAIVRNMNNHYIQLTNYIAKQHGRY